jgi:hypothetical protein
MVISPECRFRMEQKVYNGGLLRERRGVPLIADVVINDGQLRIRPLPPANEERAGDCSRSNTVETGRVKVQAGSGIHPFLRLNLKPAV